MNTPIRCSLLLTATLLLVACSPADDAPATGAPPTAGTNAPTEVAEAAGRGLVVEDAWIRSAPPGAPALAGYATLRNGTAAAIAVRACPSDGFASTELHETLHEDGMARMRPLPELVVPADGQAMLAPGGAHLMLMKPAAIPAVGDVVTVCLSVGGESRQVPFAVRSAAGPAAMPQDHDHSGGHEH